MDNKSITIGLPRASFTTIPSLVSYHSLTIDTSVDTCIHSRLIDDYPPTVYLCPYCESIYNEYHSNCKNCGAPLMMKPIRRCE